MTGVYRRDSAHPHHTPVSSGIRATRLGDVAFFPDMTHMQILDVEFCDSIFDTAP
jgi:hypothetical protein